MAVSIFIIKSGYDIIKPAANELLESSLPEEQEKEIRTFVESVPGLIMCTICAPVASATA